MPQRMAAAGFMRLLAGDRRLQATLKAKLRRHAFERTQKPDAILRRDNDRTEPASDLKAVAGQRRRGEHRRSRADALDQCRVDPATHRTDLNEYTLVAHDVGGTEEHPEHEPHRRAQNRKTGGIEALRLAESQCRADSQHADAEAPPNA
jgi:hypothetical protein